MEKEQHIIFFDGVCNLCNASVNFIIDRDKRSKFKFAALQDEKSREILRDLAIPEQLSSILYFENGKLYDRSTAVLRISRHMDGLWPAFYLLVIIPRFIRNPIYQLIAKNRYKWFGKKETCRIPEPGIENRFL